MHLQNIHFHLDTLQSKHEFSGEEYSMPFRDCIIEEEHYFLHKIAASQQFIKVLIGKFFFLNFDK